MLGVMRGDRWFTDLLIVQQPGPLVLKRGQITEGTEGNPDGSHMIKGTI